MSEATVTQRHSYAYMVRRHRGARFRHPSEDAATAKAKRLAEGEPGSTYLVLQEVLRVTVPVSTPAPGEARCDSGGAPNAPDANGAVVATPDVNGGRAPDGAFLSVGIATSESGEPRTSSISVAYPPVAAVEPGGSTLPMPPGSPHLDQENIHEG